MQKNLHSSDEAIYIYEHRWNMQTMNEILLCSSKTEWYHLLDYGAI